ncbi:hypothetical protein SAMN05443144_11297 [Fodinibius roseus]|uniref:Uncharacterized protein n=1 Tax=Fodinibius roseus TaxID=1194090 RepID=A0A1M5E1R5_9BACT|nr:hypothetical protein [Fodinibius roseus]SHF73011.1 hypothetical protein SAMN05443144_11297 [Fodinibius roseus]
MPYLNLFDEISSIGEKFLKSTDRGHKALKNYTWQLGSINELIKHTHSLVIEKLEAIEGTENMPEAQQVIDSLSGGPLSDSFRINGLCDIFVGFGVSLRKIVESASENNGDEASPLSAEEQNHWVYFCDALEEREQEVAYLYSNEIQEIGDLVWNTQNINDLEEVKERARRAKHILTDQMADFDSLSKKFHKQLGR